MSLKIRRPRLGISIINGLRIVTDLAAEDLKSWDMEKHLPVEEMQDARAAIRYLRTLIDWWQLR